MTFDEVLADARRDRRHAKNLIGYSNDDAGVVHACDENWTLTAVRPWCEGTYRQLNFLRDGGHLTDAPVDCVFCLAIDKQP